MQFSLDILSQIIGAKNSFSKTECKVANYVLEHPRDVITLSISDLASKCGASDATVFRFCKQLNLNGFQEFRMELVKAVSSSEQRSDTVDLEISEDESLEKVVEKVHLINQSALSKSRDALDLEQLEAAVSLICNASNVYFFGVGASLLTAMEAKVRFMQVSPKFHVDIDPQLQALTASLLPPDSVAVVFSYSGATNDIIEITKLAQKQDAAVIVITRFLQSPLTTFADIVLMCGVNEGPYQTGSLSVKIGLLYVIDVLFTEYCRQNSSESNKNKEITSKAVIDRISSPKKYL